MGLRGIAEPRAERADVRLCLGIPCGQSLRDPEPQPDHLRVAEGRVVTLEEILAEG